MPNVKTGKRRDIMVIFELFKLDNRTKECYSVVSSINQREKRELGKEKGDPELKFVFSERESSFSLEIRAIRPSAVFGTKKESCSTRRRLHVGTGFREFPQTSRGRGFSLLGFYTLFKCIYDA